MDDLSSKHEVTLKEQDEFARTLIPDESLSTEPQTETPLPEQPAAPKQPPWVGKVMGHFKLLRLIGQGAMGMVIQAEDINLRRIVALKVLRKQLTTGEKGKKAVEQFLREARAAAALEHPNIVRVFEINQHAGWWYIAMEMVEGNSLQAIVKATGCLPPMRACPIIADAAQGLEAAHELGMIHRDIKPGNILVSRNGRGKLTDFGLVRIEDPSDPDDAFAQKSIGTPLYMAPEMIRRQPITPAVDIYSLGATLYYTLTGRPPYTGEKIEEILEQHLHNPPPRISESVEQCTPTLANLVERMMAKSPELRPSAADVAAILRAEAISLTPDTYLPTGPAGSTMGTTWHGLQSTKTQLAGLTAARTGLLTASKPNRFVHLLRMWWFWTALVPILVVVPGVGLWLYHAKTPPQKQPVPISSLFPNAPPFYGTRPEGGLPEPAEPLEKIPAFSWKGKVSLPGCRYVASKSGRYYYSIDDERAIFIRADLCVGYETAQQAQRAGKQPAP
jgi:serine/threonine protein kinase